MAQLQSVQICPILTHNQLFERVRLSSSLRTGIQLWYSPNTKSHQQRFAERSNLPQLKAKLFDERIVKIGAYPIYSFSKCTSVIYDFLCGSAQLPRLIQHIKAEYLYTQSQGHHHPRLLLWNLHQTTIFGRKLQSCNFHGWQKISRRKGVIGCCL